MVHNDVCSLFWADIELVNHLITGLPLGISKRRRITTYEGKLIIHPDLDDHNARLSELNSIVNQMRKDIECDCGRISKKKNI